MSLTPELTLYLRFFLTAIKLLHPREFCSTETLTKLSTLRVIKLKHAKSFPLSQYGYFSRAY